MNHISMYSSSSDLRHGLHRVLAVSHSLTEPVSAGEAVGWWTLLDAPEREPGRNHSLSLSALAGVFGRLHVRRVVDVARSSLGLPRLDHDVVQTRFRHSIISGKAHRAHMGRDVYGTSNKGLWDLVSADFGEAVAARYGLALGESGVLAESGRPSAEALDALRQLTAFDTSPEGDGHDTCVEWLVGRLRDLGFAVEVAGRELGRPLLIARRPSRGLSGEVALYGHYDVTPFGREHKWERPPRELTESEGRLWARGVADNKGPLAARLAALRVLEATPALTWLIQGEEETGSKVAHRLLPGVMAALSPTLWLDETGYHDHEDGTLRLLARSVGGGVASAPPDGRLDELLRALRGLASRWGITARHECRGLNKTVVEGGCPFNASLPEGGRYLAVGVNDSRSRIHGRDESLPGWTFPLHQAELDVIFRWVDLTARTAS